MFDFVETKTIGTDDSLPKFTPYQNLQGICHEKEGLASSVIALIPIEILITCRARKP